MDDLSKRKNNRLKDYDYSQNGYYFVTICANNRKRLFGEIVGAIHESPESKTFCQLNKNVQILNLFIGQLPVRYNIIKIEKFVIMPNHIHLIIEISQESAIRESPLQVNRSLISQVVGYLKMNTTKQIRFSNQNEIDIWQRSFHDHIIRNEQEYQKIWEYIDTNPMKWSLDKYYSE